MIGNKMYSICGDDMIWPINRVDIANFGPVVCTLACTASADTTSGQAPLTVSFTGNVVGTGCTGTSAYAWAFGDGATSTQQNPAHIYTGYGNYNWSLTVILAGKTCSKSGTISVSGPNILYSSHGSFTQVTGDGDSYFEKGEKWSIPITVTNSGNTPATNVTAELSGSGITVCNNPGVFGTIPAGGSATYTYEFLVSSTFSPCGGAVNFNLVNKACVEKTPAGGDESGLFSINVGQLSAGVPTGLVLQPSTADSYVNQALPGTNYGTATTMYIQAKTKTAKRALAQFDLSSIPSGSTINSATLELYAASIVGTTTLNVHRITGTWTETGVTWTNQPSFTSTADASISGGSGVGWRIWNVLSVVQSWYNGTNTNYGLLVKCSTETGITAITYTFATKEYSTTTYRPILRINYTPPSYWDCSYVGVGSCTTTCTSPSQPVITSITDVDACTQSGVQINYTSGTPATRHDLYKDGALAIAIYSSGTTYNPGDSNSHSYTIRAVNGYSSCYTDSSSQSKADAICSSLGEAAPGDTYENGQTWSEDKSTQSWSVLTGATGYKLYRGIQSNLQYLLTADNDSCLRYSGSSTSIDLTSDDPSAVEGRFYWYIVVGTNGAGEGSAGPNRILNSSGECP